MTFSLCMTIQSHRLTTPALYQTHHVLPGCTSDASNDGVGSCVAALPAGSGRRALEALDAKTLPSARS